MLKSRLAVAVAQCLLVISEDNSVAWRVLNHFAQDVLSIVTNVEHMEQTVMLRTVAAAILSNVPSLSTMYMGQIFNTLHQTLGINHRTALGKLTSMIPLNENGDESAIDIEVSADDRMEEETENEATKRRRIQDLPSEYDCEVKHVAWTLESQRIAAETITNLCSSDEYGIIFSLTKIVITIKVQKIIVSLIFFYQMLTQSTRMICLTRKVCMITTKIQQTQADCVEINCPLKYWSP